MNTALAPEEIRELAGRFIPGGITQPQAFGSGHINDTFRFWREDEPEEKYVLQKINRNVFHHPDQVMDNILRVTERLRGRIREEGGDAERETLRFLPAGDGRFFTLDRNGDYWRVSRFISGTVTYDKSDTAELFACSGRAFGRFLRMLDGFDAGSLHETIVNFHNTPSRFRDFRAAVEKDACGRAEDVRELIHTALSYEEFGGELLRGLESGRLPLRVTHNDTKLNNVLIDAQTGEALCVIDLDTVMPGLAAYDFGDAIRFGASTAPEDERDLEKVHFDMEMYRAYTAAYLKETRGIFTREEALSLPEGAAMMTLENGIRFLGDYLNGDVYFKVDYPEHNLTRARCQFRLLEEMMQRMEEMRDTVRALTDGN